MTLAERLHDALAVPGSHATDDRLSPDDPCVPAAVLVAIVERADPAVLLTVRHAGLRAHAGQIAFPGGRIDPGDADATAAALREAEEEIGLDPRAVRVAGLLDPYLTASGYRIQPVIGIVAGAPALRPNPAEVADIFEVPLAFLLDPANRRRGSIEVAGTVRPYHEISWGGRRIWGVTAGIIVTLATRLEAGA